MKMIKLFGLLLLLFTFVGCQEDSVAPSCTNYAVNFGPFYLKESSASLFPYTAVDSNLVFKNELNEELVFKLYLFYRDTVTYSYFDVCPFDSTLEIPFVRTEEKIVVSFKNDSLDLGIQMSFKPAFSHEGEDVTGESDLAYAFLSNNFPGFSIGLSSLITYKSGLPINTNNDYYSSLILGAKTFEHVYVTETSFVFPPSYIMYMNYDIGIVGFKITSTGMLWVFDRIE